MSVRVDRPGMRGIHPVFTPRTGSRRGAGGRATVTDERKPWRPTITPPKEGMRVILRAEPHITPKRALRRPFHFQLAPLEEFTREANAEHNEYATINGDTFSRFGARGLDVISFQTLVLDYDPKFFAVHTIQDDPIEVGRQLLDICHRGFAFRLLAGQERLWGKLDVDTMATLRSVTVTERAGEPDTRYFDLSFSQWRDSRVQRRHKGKRLPTKITIHANGRAEGMRSDTDERPATLVRIAHEFYKSTSFIDLIVRHNKELRNWPHHRSLGEFVERHHHGRPYTMRLPQKPDEDPGTFYPPGR